MHLYYAAPVAPVHVQRLRIHLPASHAAWKKCPHAGITRTSSSCTLAYSDWQNTH
jgi:hypothetical protein